MKGSARTLLILLPGPMLVQKPWFLDTCFSTFFSSIPIRKYIFWLLGKTPARLILSARYFSIVTVTFLTIELTLRKRFLFSFWPLHNHHAAVWMLHPMEFGIFRVGMPYNWIKKSGKSFVSFKRSLNIMYIQSIVCIRFYPKIRKFNVNEFY